MKIKKHMLRFVLPSAIALAVLFFANSFREQSCSPAGTAKWGVHRLALAFKGYQMQFGCYPEMIGTNNYLSTSLPELVKQKLIENISPGLSTNAWVWMDPWKTPYYVEILGITMPTNEFHRRFGKGFDIIVWSSGKNKINEDGGGDDIVDPYSKKLLRTQ